MEVAIRCVKRVSQGTDFFFFFCKRKPCSSHLKSENCNWDGEGWEKGSVQEYQESSGVLSFPLASETNCIK